ncbi:MAG: ABC transporter permease, partial [Holophagales bacterium]|nr:ABC transporter permease [Holophagales bacterium]
MSTRIAPTSVDLKQAFRRLWKRPGFSLLVVVVLGLGLGAASTIFSLRYAVSMRPLPLPEAERLVEIRTVSTRPEADVFGASEPDAADWRERSSAIETIGTYSTGRVNVLTGNRADSVAIAHVTPELFTVLGVQPLIGRTFLAEEDLPGGDVAKAVISYGTWQTLFGGRAEILGETLRTDQGSLEIVGVAPPELTFPNRTQIWIPAQSIYDLRGYDRTDPTWRRSRRWTRSVARLADHASLVQAQIELEDIGRQLQAEYAETNAEMMPEVVNLRAAESERLRPYLALLSGAALLILVICCANASSLMMMRAIRRRRELAVRWALGAGLSGLGRALLIESLVLSLAGGLLALVLTALALRLYPSLVPVALPSWFEARLDLPVVFFTFAVSLGSCLLVGSAPLWRALRGAPSTELREGAKGTARQSRWRPALVVAQITLCFLLLTAAGLLQRS